MPKLNQIMEVKRGVVKNVSVVKSGGTYGINDYVEDVDANISQGLPQFKVVGLPDKAVKEVEKELGLQ